MSDTNAAAQPGPDSAEAEAELELQNETEQQATKRLVPVSESIRYRRRAQAAEQQLEQLKAQLADAQQQLHESRSELQHLERRQKIDQMLMESEAVDLEAARLLTEIAVEQMDEADVQLAVSELKRRKPYLFRRRGGGAGSAMSGRPRQRGHADLEDAASTAVMSGNRRDLLRYLRLRRNGNA